MSDYFLFPYFFSVQSILHSLFLHLFKSRPTYLVEKNNEVGVCQRLVCQKREFAVRSSSCEV